MKEIERKSVQLVAPPTKRENFTLRFMIFLGVLSMVFFLNSIFDLSVKGYGPLYWMLIITLVFTCLRTLHEWYHYLFISIPKTPQNTKEFTVDIFTTFCAGEPYEMIEETLIAIQAITYPHKTYLCDEANDPYIKNLCKELGVHHVTRTEKINAKAGNINNALKQSSGEICVVLDPDHVPFPNFLDPIISHFNNPEVGFVQIVQAYKNSDENLIAKGASQQTYQFYGPMMMTMNSYGTVMAIGANCTFRRAALASIGGHAAGLAEDMHTAMQLHSKGWKSVYVPSVLARGLVPSTLSAYYKQQLKWSRGVFDLLVTAYPKLFKGFTWRQKLHYAIMPMHYLSGVIYLINFCIPIISLLLGQSPMNMSVVGFSVVVLPFIVSTLLIRNFVQWWVMEDEERGFHLVGGILMIGTWWIYILGLLYTIIGKKVPYVPTPKDGNEANNWPLNIPNLVMLALSLFAIAYGLNYDWNPYSIIMSGFAAINSAILFINIAASRQQQYRDFKERYSITKSITAGVKKAKIKFWIMRRSVYAGLRSAALLITISICCMILYFVKFAPKEIVSDVYIDHKTDFFILGIFSPEGDNGLSSVKQVLDIGQSLATHFDLISLYIPWGDEAQCYLPTSIMDSIYRQGAVPMISWEPWQNLFHQNGDSDINKHDEKVFKRITEGKYDGYIQNFAKQIKELNRPVYLRFAHEMDNPFYPWSKTGNNDSEEFKVAWKYIHQYFFKLGVYNVIWVWNPWKAENVDQYFPGKAYVDWLGVTNLNYGKLNSTRKWSTIEDLYQPFHQTKVFGLGLPVMLAEMGSLAKEGKQEQWLKTAFKDIKKFPEIKGFVFFNSAFDKNIPQNEIQQTLDWRIQQHDFLKKQLNLFFKDLKNYSLPELPKSLISENKSNHSNWTLDNQQLFAGTRGMIYNRGQDWTKNFHTLSIRDIRADFKEMKAMGVNTIKRYGPDIYDRNLFKTAKEENFKVHFGYWIPDHIDFLSDNEKLDRLHKKIIKSVKNLKDEPTIISWNIGNAVFQKMDHYYYKPELIYQQNAYIKWLKGLVQEIKKIDNSRVVSIDLQMDEHMLNVSERISKDIPEIDIYGIVAKYMESNNAILIKQLKVPYYFSDVEVTEKIKQLSTEKGVFISNWQDEKRIDYVTINGIKDAEGRRKIQANQLLFLWNGGVKPKQVPVIKILKPALGIFANEKLTYHVLLKHENKWILDNHILNNLKFEWYLGRTNQFGKPITLDVFATGPIAVLKIPENASDYRIYLYVIKNGEILDIIESTLHTPIEN